MYFHDGLVAPPNGAEGVAWKEVNIKVERPSIDGSCPFSSTNPSAIVKLENEIGSGSGASTIMPTATPLPDWNLGCLQQPHIPSFPPGWNPYSTFSYNSWPLTTPHSSVDPSAFNVPPVQFPTDCPPPVPQTQNAGSKPPSNSRSFVPDPNNSEEIYEWVHSLNKKCNSGSTSNTTTSQRDRSDYKSSSNSHSSKSRYNESSRSNVGASDRQHSPDRRDRDERKKRYETSKYSSKDKDRNESSRYSHKRERDERSYRDEDRGRDYRYSHSRDRNRDTRDRDHGRRKLSRDSSPDAKREKIDSRKDKKTDKSPSSKGSSEKTVNRTRPQSNSIPARHESKDEPKKSSHSSREERRHSKSVESSNSTSVCKSTRLDPDLDRGKRRSRSRSRQKYIPASKRDRINSEKDSSQQDFDFEADAIKLESDEDVLEEIGDVEKWVRSAPDDLYYERSFDGDVRAKERAKHLCDKFQTTLIAQAENARVEAEQLGTSKMEELFRLETEELAEQKQCKLKGKKCKSHSKAKGKATEGVNETSCKAAKVGTTEENDITKDCVNETSKAEDDETKDCVNETSKAKDDETKDCINETSKTEDDVKSCVSESLNKKSSSTSTILSESDNTVDDPQVPDVADNDSQLNSSNEVSQPQQPIIKSEQTEEPEIARSESSRELEEGEVDFSDENSEHEEKKPVEYILGEVISSDEEFLEDENSKGDNAKNTTKETVNEKSNSPEIIKESKESEDTSPKSKKSKSNVPQKAKSECKKQSQVTKNQCKQKCNHSKNKKKPSQSKNKTIKSSSSGDSSSDSDSDSKDGDSDSDSSDEDPLSRSDTANRELERRKMHPRRLHVELWHNDPGLMNDGPVCRCSAKAKRCGIRHGFYPGENPVPLCDPFSNNSKTLRHYRITISPPKNFLVNTPTVIDHDGHEYIFEGFSLFSHYPIDVNLPPCRVIRFNIRYDVFVEEEKFPDSFCVQELVLFEKYIFREILELVDLKYDNEEGEGCPQFHLMPRFVRQLPDNGKEILSMSRVLLHLLKKNKELVKEDDLPTLYTVEQTDWQNFADRHKGMIVTKWGMKPSSIRVDQIDRDVSGQEQEEDGIPFPLIVHFGIRPPQLSYAGNAGYQRAWRRYVKYRHLLSNMPKPSPEDKRKLLVKELKLQEMRTASTMKRDVTVAISSKGFRTTGICCDLVQHAMLIPVLVAHLRFHKALAMLEETMNYEFKNRYLLQLAMTHPSYRENFGTNPDHARNALTNCGIRQPEYGDRRIHYASTRKRGINTLINIMARFGAEEETESEITHNERLEFLGDAVVEFVTSIHLYHIFPDLEEGGLATYRAAIVQNQHLAVLAQTLELDQFMLYAHGSDLCHDSELRHAMANCFEALMGALFLDGGMEVWTQINIADRVFGQTLFGDDKALWNVWTYYPRHPLQFQEPNGDRHWVKSHTVLQKLVEFEESIGVVFTHIRLLARAFTDRSLGYNNLSQGSNQRLEFLGDTVLQLISSEYLYRHFPDHHEGHLSLLRSSLVNNRTQSLVCDDLGMTVYAMRGDPKSEMKTKDRADLLEAFLGALYIDKGLKHCVVFCSVCFFPRLNKSIIKQEWNDPKSKLQQCCLTLRAMDGKEPDIPVYKVTESLGPTNTRIYIVAVYFRGKRLATAQGHSIQEAEMNAAALALEVSGHLFPQLHHQKRIIDKTNKKHC